MGVLDFIFPKYCVVCRKLGSYLCPNCFTFLSFDVKKVCLVCDRASFDGLTHARCFSKYAIDGSFSALTYNKTVQKLLYQFKYKPYLSDLQKFLVELFYESLIQKEDFSKVLNNNIFITFIPLHGSKIKKRGYNQVELLAKGLGKKLNIQVQDFLIRTRNTKPQFGLKRGERKENVRDAFLSRPVQNLKNQTVFLVDDVVTTGSTLLEAAKVLKKAGASKVYGITLAID